MSSTTTFRQEMPPPGGYNSIPFLRIPAKKVVSSRALWMGFLVFHFTGCYIWIHERRRYQRFRMEMMSAEFAIEPMLKAEKERAYLKQLRANRDEEERLMKDVPGWVVGTYYGEPIYKTRPKDEWHNVIGNEFYAHAGENALKRHFYLPRYL